MRDLTRDGTLALLALAADVREQPARYAQVRAGKTLATIFEKPSLVSPCAPTSTASI